MKRELLLILIGAVITIPITLTVEPIIKEMIYSPNITVSPSIENWNLYENTLVIPTTTNAPFSKYFANMRVEVINNGEIDVKDFCVEISTYPSEPNWLTIFSQDYPYREQTNENIDSCIPHLFSKDIISQKFRLELNIENYRKSIESNIKPTLGLKATFENGNSIEHKFEVIEENSITKQEFSTNILGKIPVLVTKSGPEQISYHEYGMISMSISSSEIMYLDSSDGINIDKIPEGISFSEIEIIKKPSLETSQKEFTWTDKIYLTIQDPFSNNNPTEIEEIGAPFGKEVLVVNKNNDTLTMVLQETGRDTGLFTGEVILTGFMPFDANNDGVPFDALNKTTKYGYHEGFLRTQSEDEINISYHYSESESISKSFPVKWNVGEIQFLKSTYSIDEKPILRVVDPDLNFDSSKKDFVYVTIQQSEQIVLWETNEATGMFEGEIPIQFLNQFRDNSMDNIITATYSDNTLPKPYGINEKLELSATTKIQ